MFLQIGYHNQPIAIVDPKGESLLRLSEAEQTKAIPKILTWCGYEDSVVNHINFL